jgi:flagellar biosynthesis chaperone FliJ
MITQQRQTIESLRQMQAELSSVIATKMAVQVSAAELKFQTAERRALQLRERTANHCAAELLQRLESQQRVLLTIRREREMLEQLHARCRRDYDRIVERKTQANLDELFLYRRR